MRKVYVVFDFDDPYCGYWIKKIFSNEESAIKYVKWFNSTDNLAKKLDSCKIDYFEEDVLDDFVDGGK